MLPVSTMQSAKITGSASPDAMTIVVGERSVSSRAVATAKRPARTTRMLSTSAFLMRVRSRQSVTMPPVSIAPTPRYRTSLLQT